VFFPFRGVPIIDKGYLFADSLLLLAEIFFISCFLCLQLSSLSLEGALELITSSFQLLIRSPLLICFGTSHLGSRGFQLTFLERYFVLETLTQLVKRFVLRA
jgi:hypothetical protein